jgi:Tol biopolymer transport system component
MGALAVLLAAEPVLAQYFGQNKVQYRRHRWSVLETEHFEVYFYEREAEAAHDAARMAERAYRRLSRILRHEIPHKVPLILYASQTDFQQTNVTPGIISEGTGGFTEFLKRRVTLPLTGSYAQLDHVLTHELVHAFEMDILWGRSRRGLGTPFAYQPPLWVMEGLAEYLSLGGVDRHTQMWLRDAALQGYLTPLSELTYVRDIRVYRFGEAVFAYIGQTYGDETLGLLLRKMARTRSLSRAVREALGLDLNKLSEDWMESVRRTFLPQIREHEKPVVFAKRLTNHEREGGNLNLSPAISPDGSLMVFLSDRSLYNDLYLASAVDGKVLYRLVKGERREAFESLRFLDATFSWAPDNRRIAFVARVGGRDAIYIMDVRSRKVLRRLRFNLDGIQAPSWSPDGRQLVFVGLHGGRSDLYMANVDGSGLIALTQDRFMEREPVFSPDGRRLAFVTDRGPDTDWKNLLFGEPRIAIMDLETGRIEVLPGQHGKNISPQWAPDGRRIVYVSDRSGIPNIFIRDLETQTDVAITDVLTGVTGVVPWGSALSLSRNGKRLLFTSFSRGGWDIYAMKNPLEREPVPLEILPEEEQPALFATVRRPPQGGDVLVLEDLPAAEPPAPPEPETRPLQDPLAAGVDTFEVRVRETRRPAPEDRLLGGAAPDSVPPPLRLADVIAETRELPDTLEMKLRPYRPRFSVDYVSGSGFFASNVGVAAQTLLFFSDVLGNHQIVVGADIYGSLFESNILLQYVNLERRTNWGVSLFQFRNDFLIFTAEDREGFVSQIYRGVELALQRPFSRFRRLELYLQGLNVDEEVFTQSFESATGFTSTRDQLYFLSPGLALVKDTALFGSTGPISGSRYRYSVEGALGDLSYWTAVVDHREYLNIRRRYALAFRWIGATSNGRDPQIFRIGGPYTLRGFDYGELAGTRVGLMNLEFRFPLIDQLRMAFPLWLELRGVRGALFFDLGAAWDDTKAFNVFGKDEQGRFHLDDLKASYGFGVSINLGFFVLRWDLSQATDLVRGTRAARSDISFGGDF